MKSYFAIPNTDCHPDGPVTLGSIILDPFDPEESLSQTPLPIPDDEIQITTMTDFEETLRHQKTHGGGLWLKFIEWMGFELSSSHENGRDNMAKFDKLTTRMFRPTADYVKKSIAVPSVNQHLVAGRHKPAYMITGVKIAYGATIKKTTSSSCNKKIFAGIDTSPVVGVPLGVGADAHSSMETERSVRFDQSMPFVFAYRLRQIRYRKGRLVDQPYRDGALYGIGGDGRAAKADGNDNGAAYRKEAASKAERVVFLGLDEDDLAADDVGGQSLETEDRVDGDDDDDGEDDGVCELVVPSGHSR